MQQRLQIARCLAQRPSVLMMDEPFGALDALTMQNLQDEVAQLVNATSLDKAIYLGDLVVALRADPTPERPTVALNLEVALPRPRNQLSTR